MQSLFAESVAGRSCSPVRIHRPPVSIEVRCDADALWELRTVGAGAYRFAPPVLPLASGPVSGAVRELQQSAQADNGEFIVSGPLQSAPDLTLRIVFRIAPGSPVVRFRYELQPSSPEAHNSFGAGPLDYFSLPAAWFTHAREVQLGNFQGLTHSYNLVETDLTPTELSAAPEFSAPYWRSATISTALSWLTSTAPPSLTPISSTPSTTSASGYPR
jgi:alpha-galactosidase